MSKIICVMLLVAGCGSSGGGAVSGSCDTRTANDACIDYSGPGDVVSVYQSNCTGTWKGGSCDHTGTVGGCRNTDTTLGLVYTTWFFAPQTAQSVMGACAAPATFVAPQ